jgi:5-methylcytosine-specific restriction endonuclease McrA
MGGCKNKDTIENLMAVCRECHLKYGDKKEHMDFLKEKHQEFMYNYGKFY